MRLGGLEPEQETLLALLVRAWRVERAEFHTLAGDDEVRVYHRGLATNGAAINPFDVEALAAAGLVRIDRRSGHGELSFVVTQAGLDRHDGAGRGAEPPANDAHRAP